MPSPIPVLLERLDDLRIQLETDYWGVPDPKDNEQVLYLILDFTYALEDEKKIDLPRVSAEWNLIFDAERPRLQRIGPQFCANVSKLLQQMAAFAGQVHEDEERKALGTPGLDEVKDGLAKVEANIQQIQSRMEQLRIDFEQFKFKYISEWSVFGLSDSGSSLSEDNSTGGVSGGSSGSVGGCGREANKLLEGRSVVKATHIEEKQNRILEILEILEHGCETITEQELRLDIAVNELEYIRGLKTQPVRPEWQPALKVT
ncbi:hypothetical protein PWT90_05489 [Aphanocladium album]|nr:hypothetical protein PWT90_05489 [Aphanocladium album]